MFLPVAVVTDPAAPLLTGAGLVCANPEPFPPADLSFSLPPSDAESLLNGNHQAGPAPADRGPSQHSAIVSSIEKDLQDIMDSLAMDDCQASSAEAKKPLSAAAGPHSALSPMVNGGGRYLLSPPTSPGAMSVGSSYENASPPFSPLSSPSAASSGSFSSPSPSGGAPEPSCCLPPVPVRSCSYSFASQPLAQPRSAAAPPAGGAGLAHGVQESPGPQRKAPLGRRAQAEDSSDGPCQAPLLFSPEAARNLVPSSPRLLHKFPPCLSPSPCSPRTKMAAALQERPASPFREVDSLPSSPSRPVPQHARTFQPPLDPVVHVIQGSPVQPSPRALQPPESPRMSRRNLDLNGMRELPPLSPSVARRGVPVLPGALPGTVPTLRTPDSPSCPRLRSKSGSACEDPGCNRGIRARSPSPTPAAEGKPGLGFSVSPAYSLGSLPGSSPVPSPRTQRKMAAGRPHPGMRERKNSISEISDNEDELLEYHRRQREERLREQEMEKLVSPRGGPGPPRPNVCCFLLGGRVGGGLGGTCLQL